MIWLLISTYKDLPFSGFYIFKEMIGRLKESGYYGIPRNMDYDGINSLGQLCSTENRALDKVPGCKPMTKLYYLQYQYMPFFMAALALTFYIPYLVFRASNNDLISLRGSMKGDNVDADDIVKNYFNYRVNSKIKMKIRVLMNIIVKILYIIANVVTLMATDFILHGQYIGYGLQYTKWSKLDNTLGNDHDLRVRKIPKPGNVLLPPMGFCDLHEATRDIRNTFINRHKFICEISPHVLYQYVLVLLWFLLIIGIVVSTIGLVMLLFGHLVHVVCFATGGDPAKRMFRVLTLRELDYLEYIRKKDIPVYGKVIQKLRDDRADITNV